MKQRFWARRGRPALWFLGGFTSALLVLSAASCSRSEPISEAKPLPFQGGVQGARPQAAAPPRAPTATPSIRARVQVVSCQSTPGGRVRRINEMPASQPFCLLVGPWTEALRVSVHGPDGEPLAEVPVPPPPPQNPLASRFQIDPPAGGWPVGSFGIVLLLGNEELARWHLDVKDQADGAAPAEQLSEED